MAFVFNKNGVYYRPVQFLTTYNGATTHVNSIMVQNSAVLKEVWTEDSTLKIFIKSDEITDSEYMSNTGMTQVMTPMEFPESGHYRLTIIGDGATGGSGGHSWGAYSGGQGGGAGTGGAITIDVDLTSGIYAYFQLGRFPVGYSVSSCPAIGNSMCCQFIGYDNTHYLRYWITPGHDGEMGESAGAFTTNPDGGAGGAGGSVYYLTSNIQNPTYNDFMHLDACDGGSGLKGGNGNASRPPIDDSGGHAGDSPENINIYTALETGGPQRLGDTPNIYQRPEGYYVATTTGNPQPIQGYTLDNLVLGNAGAGAWNTIVQGSFPRGIGAYGGVVLEKIS